MFTPLKAFLVLVLIAYPVIVFIGFKYTDPLVTNIFIILILTTRLCVTRGSKNPINTLSSYVIVLMVSICLMGIFLKQFELALLYPVFLNFALFVMFIISLGAGRTPIIETLARMKEKTLAVNALIYVRRVTIVWSIFFLINGLVSLYTFLYTSFETWTLYNGFISYILIAIIGISELSIRTILKKRWNKVRSLKLQSNFYDFNTLQFSCSDLIRDVAKMKALINAQANYQRIAISSPIPYVFACSFLAIAELGREVVMLPSYQEQTTKDYNQYYDLIVDDQLFEVALINSLDSITSSTRLKLDTKITMFTSGSSGKPQEVRKTLQNLVAECDSLEEQFGDFETSIRFFGSVSHHHIYGLLFRILWPLLRGSNIANNKIEYPEQFEIISRISNSKCVFISSPAFLKRLDLKFKNLENMALIKVFSSGGALSMDGAKRSFDFFGEWPIEIFGSTETGGIAWREQKVESASWELLPNVVVATDSRDCLNVTSPFICEGRFQTNDRVKISEGDDFKLLGRVDRVVKIEEKRLSLDELEKVLKAHTHILDAHCVVLDQGERVIIGCLIALNSQNEWKNSSKIAMVSALKTYLLQYFEPVLIPKKYRFLDQLPYNAQSKLVRSTVLGYFDETNRNSI